MLVRLTCNIYLTKVIDGEKIIVDILRKGEEHHCHISELDGGVHCKSCILSPNEYEIIGKFS